jgi:acyl-coenzyme A synthetase/AMP-(fatty) acid ligase
MDGYVKGPRVRGVWHTGDAGDIDADGYLRVRGRRDHVLATPLGRNISPEWIEALLAADARVSTSMVTHISGPHLTALLVPAPGAEAWFDGATPEDLGGLIADCCAGAPRYARPRSVVVASLQQLQRRGVLTVDRRFRRQAALNSGLFERAVAVPLGTDPRELAT